MVKQPEIAGNHIFRRCIYCNNTFAPKLTLDDHIAKRHPDFIASVGSKVHDCTECTSKTVSTSLLKQHYMAKHPDTASNPNTNRCIHCSRTFKSTQSLDDHIVKRHPDFMASVSSKVHECTKCTYKTVSTSLLRRHMVNHRNREIYRCIYCNKTFTRKPSLDDHIVKIHPDFVTSVSSKVHECTECTYKTVSTSLLRRHNTVNHPDAAAHRCMYCNKTFRSTQSLDDHIVRIHPDFITSVSRKVHECTGCTYKTVSTYLLRRHNMEIAGNRIFRCVYCNNTFARKVTLDDHIVKRHPDFIASVSGKVYECAKCTFKTVSASQLKRHLVDKHPDTAGDRKTNTCLYCNKTLSTKPLLDDHVVKRHPDFVASVSRKIHECTKCTYKTTRSKCIREHLLAKHSEIGDHYIFRCICDKPFTRKEALDDHIVKTHPDFTSSFSSKVRECSKCTYKTIRPSHLKRHIAAKRNRTTNRCIYCNKTFKSTRSLDNHIVKKHPDFITSISRKVHECTECTYKTVGAYLLRRHNMVNHPVTLDDHIVKRHPDFIATISSKVHECTECTFKTVSTSQLKRHIVATGNGKTNRCIHCNKTLSSKMSLDDHIVKRHPDFIASVSYKVHECTKCTYKTIRNIELKKHIMAKHPDISGTSATNRCIYCNKTFKRKRSLDDHIVKIHPDFITSVSRKVHECTECAYKTVSTQSLDDHVVKIHPDFITSVSSKVHECTECIYKSVSTTLFKQHVTSKHPDIAGNFKTNRCIYCNKTLSRKTSLHDHIVKRHPDFIASVSCKVHECTKCTYKTIRSIELKKHMMAGNRKTNRCIYCNKTFKSTQSLNDHIVKMHPDFITSVSSKVHECTGCTYRAVSTTLLKQRVTAKHPDIAGNRKTNRCIYCNKTLSSKTSLQDHIVKRHPDFVASVSCKVHQYTKCTYKAIRNIELKKHFMAKHLDIASNRTTNRCIYCNTTFTR
nr:unnamed protein product [Callosobruchus analis]